MANLILPKNYEPVLDLMESQRAIKKIKDRKSTRLNSSH